jgi:predicted nucleotidyltransferase
MKITVRNDCSVERIAPLYRPLVDDAIAAYREIVRDGLAEVRLLGSVARGTAVAGQSDIDFMAVLTDGPPDRVRTALQSRADSLLTQYPVVSKVDLDVVVFGRLGPAQRFILATDSVNLFGEDALTEGAVAIEADELAALVTPDLHALLPSYTQSVQHTDAQDSTSLFRWSRWCGKDILKCLRGTAIRRENRYERDVRRIHEQVCRCFPEHQRVLGDVFALYADPKPDRDWILAVLHRTKDVFVTSEGIQGAEPTVRADG